MGAPKGNTYAEAKLIFKTPEDLEQRIDEYFKSDDAHIIDSDGKKFPAPTMAGLALYLEVDRKTLVNYSHREKYFPAIKKARARVELFLEKRLYGNNVTGTIFSLKNNFDWSDKTTVDNTSSDGSMTPTKIVREIVSATEHKDT